MSSLPTSAGPSAARRSRGRSSTCGRRRLAVASRTTAAIAGGYLVAALATAFLSLYLPLPRSEATAAATLLAFAVYTIVAITSFTASSALVAWARISVTAAALAGAMLVFGGSGS